MVLPPWTAPVDWSSVNHNDESRQRLQEAASIFGSLLHDSTDKSQKENLEGWLLGSLANDRSTQKRAEDECRNLLEQSALHAPAIAWAIARKYPVIGSQTRSAFASARTSHSLEPDQVLSLVLAYIGDEDIKAAGEVLDEARQKFIDADGENLWRFWRAQIHLTTGEIDKVSELFGGINLVPLELLPLVKRKSHQQLLLANRELDNLHGRALLDVCISKAKLGENDYIIANAKRLISEVRTEQSVRVVAHALIKADQYEDCVNLLTTNTSLFNGQTLPHDLQLVQAQCYQRLGFLNRAVEQAERAVLLTPNTQTMLAYVTMLLQTGNMSAMLTMVRRLSRQTDLTPVQAIRLAEVIHQDDPLTAKKLWQKSTSGRLKGEYIFRAITLGYRLGLERDPAYINFYRQIQHIAQAGSKQIRAVTLDEAAEEFKRQREANQKRAKSYWEAIGPVHFIYTLPLLYHDAAASTKGSVGLLNKYPVFAFHEDRHAASEFPDEKPGWRLNVDISALMIAHEFGFLESVVDANECIVIPSETIPTLLAARQELQILPKDRAASIEQILKSITDQRILTFECTDSEPPSNREVSATQMAQIQTDKLTEYIKQQEGWFVDFISQIGSATDASQSMHFPQRTDASSVVLSLKSNALLSDEQVDAALKLLPKADPKYSLAEPPLRAKLYMHATMLESFSQACVFDQIINNFQVHLSNNDRCGLKQTLDRNIAAIECHRSLTALIDLLNAYIQQDKIRVLPHFNRDVRPDSEASVEPLYSLLQMSPQPHDALWIDDRFVNKFIQRDKGPPIVTSWEVLKGLAIGSFGKQNYYETLIKMRRANIRYIPVEADEILFHLRQALIQDDELIETSNLQTLRSYIAACIYQHNMVHKHQSNSDPILFFERLRQGIIGAWDQVWKTDVSHDLKTLWASWLHNKLFAEPRSLCMIVIGSLNNKALSCVIGELLFTALVMFDRGGDAADLYLKWLFNCCLKTLFQNHSELAKEVAAVLKQMVMAHLAGEMEPSRVLPIFQWWYYHMPEIIRRELSADADSMSLLRLRNVSFGDMFGFTFLWDDLEKAIKKALSSGVSQPIKTQQEGQVEISAQMLADKRVAITLTSPERSLSFADDEAQYLFNVPYERRLALIRQPQWIDIAPAKFESIVSKLAYTEPASIRIDELQRWQGLNANAYYAILEEALRARQRLNYDRFLPPNVESLLNHNRIDDPNQFDLFETLKLALHEEVHTFGEISAGLPCILTDNLLTEIDNYPASTKRKLVRTLLSTRTPLSLIQVVKILGTPSNNRAYTLLRRRILNHLLASESLTEFEAFIAVLRWIGNRFAGKPDVRNLPWNIRLALVWLHASKLFGVLRSSGQPVAWIAETFDRGHTLTSVALIDSTSPIRADAATPNVVTAERLLASGLFYCMSGDELVKWESQLVDLTLLHVGGQEIFPKPGFFRAPPQSNVFNSFLGTDFGELVHPDSRLQALSIKSLNAIASEGIQRIKDNNQPHFWWLVLAYVVPRANRLNEFSDAIGSLVEERGLLQLAKEAKSAFAPIFVATANAKADGNLASLLIDDLKQIAIRADRDITDLNGSESDSMLYQSFIDAGLKLSCKDGKFDPIFFCELMIDLCQRRTQFATGLKGFMNDLWEELPAEESAAFWRLRVYLAAV